MHSVSAPGDEAAARVIAERYARFAADEAPGRSALYEQWAAGVASDPAVLAVLARIPAQRRQPPLVFAVGRMLGAPEGGYDAFADWVRRERDALVAECSRRSLQTNEPQRCAAMLPALSLIGGPLALLEIGASAGLCLYPDRYSYRFAGDVDLDLDPRDGASAVVLSCAVRGAPPLAMPEVVWRAGIDLAPLDAADPRDRRFLQALVWPGETGRRARITAALDIAAADPPAIIRGDATDARILRAALESARQAAPAGATLVVTTPGVLPHIPRAGRERLVAALEGLVAHGVRWVTIDPAGLPAAWRPPVAAEHGDGFVLGLDGAPLAVVDPLGATVEWRR